MKKIPLILLGLLYPFLMSAQDISSDDQSIIDQYILSNTISEKTLLPADTLSRVFTGTFYRVQAGFNEQNGHSLCNNYYFNIKDGNLAELEEFTTNMKAEQLPLFIRPDFRLNDENSARLFEASLNKIYPFDEEEGDVVKHLKKDNQWIFIRGKFFDKFSAFLVATDQEGKITGIDYSLEYTGN